MNAQELYELVEYHYDVWGGTMRWDDSDTTLTPIGFYGVDDTDSGHIPMGIAELTLLGLFAIATGYSVRKTMCEDPGLAWVAEAPWKPAHHGRNPLEALVRARDAQQESNP